MSDFELQQDGTQRWCGRGTEERRRQHVAGIVSLTAGYVSCFLVLRWLRTAIFEGHGPYGWPVPSVPSLLHLASMTVLPVCLWAVLGHRIWCRLPRGFSPGVLALLLFVVVGALEVDAAWYRVSETHIGWREARLFLTDDLGEWGVPPETRRFYALRIGKHAVALTLFWLAAGAVSRRPRVRFGPRLRPQQVWSLLLPLYALDLALVGHAFSRDREQWVHVSQRNPLRPSFLDRLAEGFFRQGADDLGAANEAYARARALVVATGEPAAGAWRRPRPAPVGDVLVVTVEGWNPLYVDADTMPYLAELARRSLVFANHYSSGNATEYGILGLLYGAPVDFLGDARPRSWREPRSFELARQPGSVYVDAFQRRGYDTRIVSREILEWAQLASYLHNFSRPAREAPFPMGDVRGDPALVPWVLEELSGESPRFVYTHLAGTHFPFTHAAEHSRFQPEVPEEFDYFAFDLREHRLEIVNRYKNCLSGLDAWLRAVVGSLDLERTIVVVTGDHGEEFFESGRFTHANGLTEPQMRTPLLISVPGEPARVIHEVTSHADIMPTLMALLGWEDPGSGAGRVLLDPGAAASAVVAFVNRPHPPERWAVVTQGVKSIVRGRPGGQVEIVGLFDSADQALRFRDDPSRWRENFAAVARFERRLGRTPGVVPPGEDATPTRLTAAGR